MPLQLGRQLKPALNLSDHRRVELPPTAQNVEPDAVLLQGVEFAAQVLLEQVHQRPDLVAGPLPVLGRESVEGQHLEAEFSARLDHVPHRRRTFTMALDPHPAALLSPATVAVHDDGNVPRQRLEIEATSHQLGS